MPPFVYLPCIMCYLKEETKVVATMYCTTNIYICVIVLRMCRVAYKCTLYVCCTHSANHTDSWITTGYLHGLNVRTVDHVTTEVLYDDGVWYRGWLS